MAEHSNRRSYRFDFLVSTLLTAATITVFWQMKNYDFIHLDDGGYVYENQVVQTGLTWEGFVWAFTTTDSANWHPITWLSHMLDCQLYGLNPGGHHVTNVLLHIANTLLMFAVFKRMTGSPRRSAFVAALFALHPLHVESVAWISERKDVLSTFFCMLTIWAYVDYVQTSRPIRYFFMLLFFALGLMAKPMLVTLPFVLVLLDYWPLQRFRFGRPVGDSTSRKQTTLDVKGQRHSFTTLVMEKIPMFVLSALSCTITVFAQSSQGAVKSLISYPLPSRIANALVSYWVYVKKALLPTKLGFFYPYPEAIPLWKSVGAGFLLLFISVLVVHISRRHGYLVTGWFWYLGTLVPVIGLVQVGYQAMADRYTYIPLTGLFVAVVWGAHALATKWRLKSMVFVISAGILLLLSMGTLLQGRYWKDTMTLYEHTLEVTSNNYYIHENMGLEFAREDELEKAVSHLTEALRIKPGLANIHNNIGTILVRQGKLKDAVWHYLEALEVIPDFVEARYNLGMALARQGKLDESIVQFLNAIQIKTDFAEAHYRLGQVFFRQGKLEGAIEHFQKALLIKPEFAKAKQSLIQAQKLRR